MPRPFDAPARPLQPLDQRDIGGELQLVGQQGEGLGGQLDIPSRFFVSRTLWTVSLVGSPPAAFPMMTSKPATSAASSADSSLMGRSCPVC